MSDEECAGISDVPVASGQPPQPSGDSLCMLGFLPIVSQINIESAMPDKA